jgi:hypothetical protein
VFVLEGKTDPSASKTSRNSGLHVDGVEVRLLSYILSPALDKMAPLSPSSRSGMVILQSEVQEMRGDSSSGDGFAGFIERQKSGAPLL